MTVRTVVRMSRCMWACLNCCRIEPDFIDKEICDFDQIKSTGNYDFIVAAVFDFEKQHKDDLSFSRGDRMGVLNTENENWWKAEHFDKNEVGMIPSTFVRRLEPYPENHAGWTIVNRKEAITLLSQNGDGVFLIRPYVRDDAYCAISMTYIDTVNNALAVRHFKVYKEEDGKFRFCGRCSEADFFYLIEKHKDPPSCDCGVVLRKHCIDKPNTIPRQFMIDRNSLVKIRTLGHGFFGEVWLGKKESTEVAVKQLRFELSPYPNLVQESLEEARRQCRIKHRYIVQLLGVCIDEPLLIVLEYVELGALNKFLAQDAGNQVSFSRLCMMSGMIADGMDYLNNKHHLIHRDLRGANVLVKRDLSVKIADFGLARDSDYIPTNFQLPVRWTAPEAFSSAGHSAKADVWSYGVLLYEMVTYGGIPYSEMSKAEVKKSVIEGYRLDNPHGRKIIGTNKNIECPDSMYATMRQCWSTDPQNRPNFDYLHCFFTELAGMTESQYLTIENIC